VRRIGVQAWLLLGAALRGLRANSVTSALAMATIAVALVLVGAFALLLGNMRGLLERFGEQLQVTAYLEDGIGEDGGRELAARVAEVEGVQTVALVSKREALERFRHSLGGADLLEGLDENPLPASLEIVLRPERRTPEGMAVVAEALEGMPGIDELAHGHEWMEGYSRAAALAGAVAVGLGAVLGLSALLIVSNTIRLAVYAREEELAILSLVGASRTYLRAPFLIEGTLQGAAGGLLALAVLYAGFRGLVPEIEAGLSLFLGNAPPRFFAPSEMALLVAAGAGLGLLGSASALVGWRQ
jgi:cell division transport system permease protein